MRRGRRLHLNLALGAALLGVMGGCGAPAPPPDRVVAGGDPSRGIVALRQHGCGGCHLIRGLPEARGAVGPPLDGLPGRAYIAGRLTNHTMNLTRWIQSPRAVDPGTLMPDLGVSDAEARDIAAYLYTLDSGITADVPRWPSGMRR
jgi:cytochrome c